jgi:hypothetical protein
MNSIFTPGDPYQTNERFMDAVFDSDIPYSTKERIDRICYHAYETQQMYMSDIINVFYLLGFKTINFIDTSCCSTPRTLPLPENDSEVIEKNFDYLEALPRVKHELQEAMSESNVNFRRENRELIRQMNRHILFLRRAYFFSEGEYQHFLHCIDRLKKIEQIQIEPTEELEARARHELMDCIEQWNRNLDRKEEENLKMFNEVYGRVGEELGKPISMDALYNYYKSQTAEENHVKLDRLKEIKHPRTRSAKVIVEERAAMFDTSKGKRRLTRKARGRRV